MGALGLGAPACSKAPPPDVHLGEAARLVQSDPQRALAEIDQARDPGSGSAELLRGLAYEGLQDYARAEQSLEKARASLADPAVRLALVRVRVMLGKLEEARRGIDEVIGALSADLGALLLEALLANDAPRARASLQRLEAWAKPPSLDAGAHLVPAELHLARATLLARLGELDRVRAARQDADRAGLDSERSAMALVALAIRAGQRELAAQLLARLAKELHDPHSLAQGAALSHAIGAHEITGRFLALLPDRPDDAVTLRIRAEHQFLTAAPSAMVTIERALRATPDQRSAQYARLQLMFAECLVRKGDRARARVELEKLRQLQPGSLPTALTLARLDLIEGQPRAAATRLGPLAKRGAPAAVYELLGVAELEAKDLVAATAHLEEALRLEPGNVKTLSTLVELDERAGRRAEAVKRVRREVEKAPKRADLWLLLARLTDDPRAPAAAEGVLREALASVPGDVRLWSTLRALQERRGARDEALATLREAEQKNPRSAAVLAEIASFLARTGDARQAVAYYERVLRLAEGDVVTLNNTAMLYAEDLGDAAKAVELAERAHRLAPDQAAVTDTLAWALFKRRGKGDLERARRLLQQIDSPSASATVKYHLGAVLLAAGEAAEGKRLLREALAAPGEFADAPAARKALAEAR